MNSIAVVHILSYRVGYVTIAYNWRSKFLRPMMKTFFIHFESQKL